MLYGRTNAYLTRTGLEVQLSLGRGGENSGERFTGEMLEFSLKAFYNPMGFTLKTGLGN